VKYYVIPSTGITLDKDDLMLVSIKEVVENPAAPPPNCSSDSGDYSTDENERAGPPGRRRKRKKKKGKGADGETPSKSARTEDDSDIFNSDVRTDDVDTSTGTPMKPNMTRNGSNMDNSNLESNDSYFTLHDIKQDHSDDDLIEIIKEEPGFNSPTSQPHIVSIQSLNSASNMPNPMNPMASPSGPVNPGQMPAGLHMAPGQYEDLMQVQSYGYLVIVNNTFTLVQQCL
jgi:hypothetical protein